MLTASNADLALDLSRSVRDLNVLVTDESDEGEGLELALTLLNERPGIGVLLTSAGLPFRPPQNTRFLSKPFLPQQLVDMVSSLLDSPSRSTNEPYHSSVVDVEFYLRQRVLCAQKEYTAAASEYKRLAGLFVDLGALSPDGTTALKAAIHLHNRCYSKYLGALELYKRFVLTIGRK